MAVARYWRFSEVVERKSEPDSAEHQQQKQQTAFTQTVVAAFVELLYGGAHAVKLAAVVRGRAAPLRSPCAIASPGATRDRADAACRQEHGLVELVDERRRRWLALHRVVVNVKVCDRPSHDHVAYSHTC